MISRRLGILGGLVPVASVSQAKAERGITLMVGAPENSGPDKVARDFAACFQSHLDSIPVKMRNLPGSAGHTMLGALGDAPADSHIPGWVSTPILPARMVHSNDPPLIRLIKLLGLVERESVAFVSPASHPVDSMQDIIPGDACVDWYARGVGGATEHAREGAAREINKIPADRQQKKRSIHRSAGIIQRAGNDADVVPLGTPPAGSPPHLAVLRLQVLAQTRINIVTFPSAAAAAQAVLAANVLAAALGLSDVIEGLRDGKLTAVGLAARSRLDLLPDTPALSEVVFRWLPSSAAASRCPSAPRPSSRTC